MTPLLVFEGNIMSSYELIFIISPEIADDEVTTAVNKVSELVSKVGGSVTEVSRWGKKKLAYPVKRFTEGNYVLAKLELKPVLVQELEANLRMSGDVLRHLLVKAGE